MARLACRTGLQMDLPNTVEDLLEQYHGIICHCNGEKKCTQCFACNLWCCSNNDRWHNYSVRVNSTLFASIFVGKHMLYSE